VGLILDLAVVVLGMVVIGSLALLAWTLAVSSVHATRDGRARVAATRQSVTDAEADLRTTARRASSTMAELAARIAPGDRPDR
jgi:hypothetical protein